MTLKLTTDKVGSKAVLIRVPHDLAKSIKHLAIELDKSFQDVAIEAFRDILKKYGGRKVPNE